MQKSTPNLGPFGVSCPFFSFGLLRVSCPFLSFWAQSTDQIRLLRPCTLTPKVGDGQWLHGFPQCWGWAMAPLLPQKGGWLHGSTASPKRGMGYGSTASPVLGMGNGSTACPKRGMAPWLHSFPKGGVGYSLTASPMLGMGNGSTAPLLPQGRDRQMPIGWDREGCAPAVCIFGRGYGKAHRMYFWEGLSPKRGLHCVHPRPSRNATGRHVGLLACDIG